VDATNRSTQHACSHREIQQWRDLAFCLSLLNYHDKAMKKLMENFNFYSESLRDEQVYFAFNAVITKSKKFARPELKVIL